MQLQSANYNTYITIPYCVTFGPEFKLLLKEREFQKGR